MAYSDAVASQVPASAAGFVGFERRLRSGRVGVDFAFSLSTYGHEWLRNCEAWEQIRVVASMFYDPSPIPHRVFGWSSTPRAMALTNPCRRMRS